MDQNNEAHDDLGTAPPHVESSEVPQTRQHRRSESEAGTNFTILESPRHSNSSHQARDFADVRWKGITHNTASGLFGSSARRRFGSTASPTHRPSSFSRHGWRTNDSATSADGDDDGKRKLVSLSDLIHKEDIVPLLYENAGDTGLAMDARDSEWGLTQQDRNYGTVGLSEAMKAAEHGNSIHLSVYLQDGGDPAAISRLHPRPWSLLHLAAGCATIGWRTSNVAFSTYRPRPESDCKDGYATCVSELLAAGADPNVTVNGITPLMSAALTGSKDCCWLLLRAGAKLDAKTDDRLTVHDYARKARPVGGGRNTQHSVPAVLRDPPRKVPRSPSSVRATLVQLSRFEPEDAVPPVEVRWRVPSQASLAPAICSDVERYYLKCWCRGKGKEVIRTKTSTVDVPRRDFCRNQIIDRGIALRKNLCLPQPHTASAIVHGLQAGETYSFTVSCVAEVEGSLRHSPPSCMSKPLLIPEAKEDHQWHLGGMFSMVTGKDTPSSQGAGDGGALQVQDGSGTPGDHRYSPSNQSNEEVDAYTNNTVLGQSLHGNTKPRNPTKDVPWKSPRRHSINGPQGSAVHRQPYAGPTTGTGPLLQNSTPRLPARSSTGVAGLMSPDLPPPLDHSQGRHSLPDSVTQGLLVPRGVRETDEGARALAMSTNRSNRGSRAKDPYESFQDESCTIS